MSKLSFRARALDASKPMPVYKTEEIPDLPDFAAINRAVPQMPTGMEKEEETEHHLQRALSAQQVYGTAEALVIPIPEIDVVTPTYKELYECEGGFKPPRQYIHVQPFGMDQEIPDYDMDSDDEVWLNKQSRKLEVSPLKFETMMDRLEKGSGQTVMTLNEAKALLKEDDDLIIAIYDYWLNKRLRLQRSLIPTVRTEKRDGGSSNNPYVAFRRRTEKMQTRKNRKNDEVSYEKMLKLQRDLKKSLTILELMKRREKSKKELLKLTIEIFEKRYQMQDFDGQVYSEANAKRHTLPSTFIQSYNEYINARKWAERVNRQERYEVQQEEQTYSKKTKRKYNRRKEHHHQPSTSIPAVSRSEVRGQSSLVGHTPALSSPPASSQLQQYTEVEVLNDAYTSDEEEMTPISPPSVSDHEQDSETDPDGPYAFVRKSGCYYHAPIDSGRGNWPWFGPEEGGFGESKYRFSLISLATPRPRCLGFGRRRIGRGGRVLVDRLRSDWDEELDGLDMTTAPEDEDFVSHQYTQHIHHNHIPHYRPSSPPPRDDTHLPSDPSRNLFGAENRLSPTLSASHCEFSVETYERHREQLLQMTRAQQEHALIQDFSGGNTSIGFHSYCGSSTDPADSGGGVGATRSGANTPSGSFSSAFNGGVDMLGQSFNSQPNSKFTLDSERAHFAASAVCNVTSQSKQQSASVNDLAHGSSGSVLVLATSNVGTSDIMNSLLTSSNATASRTNSPNVFQNGPLEAKASVFSTSPAANVLQLNYPISDSVCISSHFPTSSTSSNNKLQTSSQSSSDNFSNNSNTVTVSLVPATSVSIVTSLGHQISGASLAQSLAAGTLSFVAAPAAGGFADHVTTPQRSVATAQLVSTTTVNNGSRVPVVSMATKCVSPATPTLLKIGSTATNQHRANKDSLECATILKDKVVAMEVT